MPPAQERAPSSSNYIGDAPTIDPSPMKKTVSKKKKKKASKKQVAGKAKQVERVDTPTSQQARYRYEPYRRADPTPEPEGNLPADSEDLETLDATAKMLYKSDREVLEYIEALNHRTAAMLEHVNRNGSQLRSCKGAMERIDLFVDNWQKMDDHWTHQQLFGDGTFRAKWEDGKMKVLDPDESSEEEDDAPYAKNFASPRYVLDIPFNRNPDLFPTLTRDENGAFPPVEDHLSKYVKLRSLNCRALAYT